MFSLQRQAKPTNLTHVCLDKTVTNLYLGDVLGNFVNLQRPTEYEKTVFDLRVVWMASYWIKLCPKAILWQKYNSVLLLGNYIGFI